MALMASQTIHYDNLPFSYDLEYLVKVKMLFAFELIVAEKFNLVALGNSILYEFTLV